MRTFRVERIFLFLRQNKRSLGKSVWPSPIFRSSTSIRRCCQFNMYVPISCITAHLKCKPRGQGLTHHFLRIWSKIFSVFTDFHFLSLFEPQPYCSFACMKDVMSTLMTRWLHLNKTVYSVLPWSMWMKLINEKVSRFLCETDSDGLSQL